MDVGVEVMVGDCDNVNKVVAIIKYGPRSVESIVILIFGLSCF